MFTLCILAFLVGIFILLASRSAQEAERPKVRGLGAFLLVLSFGFFILAGIRVIPAGNVGVVSVFGSVSQTPLYEGLHVVNPLSSIEVLSSRTQEYTMSATSNEGAVQGDDSIKTLSKDGLPLPIDITITYRPSPIAAPWLYRNIGLQSDFIPKLIRPAARAAARDAFSQFTAQEAYSTKREEVARMVETGLQSYLENTLKSSPNYPGAAFIIQQVLVRNIELPERLKASIEAKLTAEQEALRMQYVLQKERQESERKKIEAQGIADFQAVVSQGISDKLLMWKGIEATQELAKSPNAKVVVIGSGKSGLPIILNTEGDLVGSASPKKGK